MRATGTVSEFNGLTEITATTARLGGGHQRRQQPRPGDARRRSTCRSSASSTTSTRRARGCRSPSSTRSPCRSTSSSARYGQIELYEGGRPRQFTEANAPSVAGNAAHLDSPRPPAGHPRRRQQQRRTDAVLTPARRQPVRLPPARQRRLLGRHPGDRLLPRRRPGQRPDRRPALVVRRPGRHRRLAHPPDRRQPGDLHRRQPAPGDAAGGGRRHQGRRHEPPQLLHHDRHHRRAPAPAPAAPSGTLDCRGADSVAELNRQRERASIVHLHAQRRRLRLRGAREHHRRAPPITDLLGAVNARCGGAHPYAFVNTGGTLGTDAIRVQLIYRTGILSPVGAPLVRPRPDPQPAADRPDLRRRRRGQPGLRPALHGDRQPLQVQGLRAPACRRRRRHRRRRRAAPTPRAPRRPTACSPGSTAPCSRPRAIPTSCSSATSTPTPRKTRSTP